MGAGFTAPPISFAVNGKQYVAIPTGLFAKPCDGWAVDSDR